MFVGSLLIAYFQLLRWGTNPNNKRWNNGTNSVGGGGEIRVMPSIVYKKMYVGNVTKQGTWFLEEYPYVLEFLVRRPLHFCI